MQDITIEGFNSWQELLYVTVNERDISAGIGKSTVVDKELALHIADPDSIVPISSIPDGPSSKLGVWEEKKKEN